MGKELKNVIVLRNIYSQFFEEVIFVLKKDIKQTKSNSSIIFEARKVIDDYIKRQELYDMVKVEKQKTFEKIERGNGVNTILNISLMVSIGLFIVLLIKAF